MDDATVRRFLRYYYAPLVDFALEQAGLNDRERQAVLLCGRRQLTIEAAAESAGVSVNTMQQRWQTARRRLCAAWSGSQWVKLIADTVE